MEQITIHSFPNAFPSQAVSEATKRTTGWKHGVMNFMDYESTSQTSEKYDILRNYRIVSGDIDLKDYNYLKDPLNLGAEVKAKYGTTMDIKHYPIMIRPIQSILGEYIKRPTNFFVVNESPDAKNSFVETKTEMLQDWAIQQVQQRIAMRLKKQGIDVETEEGQAQISSILPEQIEEYMNKDYYDAAEETSQVLIKRIWRRENLDDTFLDGFRHAVISSREFYHTYLINGKVKVRSISPMDVFYHRSPSVKWISDAQYAGYRLYLTPSSIIDLFYDKLTSKDIKEIERLTGLYQPMGPNGKTGIDSINYDTSTFSDFAGNMFSFYRDQVQEMIDDFQMHGTNSLYQSRIGLIKVVQAYWKSLRRIGTLTYYDEFGRSQKTIVDENYKPNIDQGEYVTYQYINQVYEGAKIGEHIYLNVQPYTDYVLDIDNLDDCPLPIDGCTYNDTHSKPVSPVDLMKPWNELYNIVAYELKKDMNSSLGKVLFMSTDHIPNIPGFTWDKWYYWARELKIAWVKQPPRGPNTFNQFSSADMSFADMMTARMNLLERIKMECDSIAGFSPSRIGQPTANQTLGESSQQLVASVNQTEYYFFKHYKLIQRVLNYALNLARTSEQETEVLRNMFDDMDQRFIQDYGDLSNAKLSLFVTNSAEDVMKREKLQQLLGLATSNGADIVDVGELLMANTVSEINKLFKGLRKKSNDLQKAKNQHETELVELQNEDKEAERDWQREKLDKELESEEYRTYMQTFARQADNLKDTDRSGIADVLEYDKFAADAVDRNRNMLLKERKQYMDEVFKKREMELKEKDIKVKELKTKNDIKVAKINPG